MKEDIPASSIDEDSQEEAEASLPKRNAISLLSITLTTVPFAMVGLVLALEGFWALAMLGLFPLLGMMGGVSVLQFWSMLVTAFGLSALGFLTLGMFGAFLIDLAGALLKLDPVKFGESGWGAAIFVSLLAPLIIIPGNGLLSLIWPRLWFVAKVPFLALMIFGWGLAVAMILLLKA